MFQIRYKDAENAPWVVKTLRPHPTTVAYGEGRLYTTQTSVDGNVVIQRPYRDARVKEWIWSGGWPVSLVGFYEQWTFQKTLEYRRRQQAGLYPFVGIWEDESTRGGFARMDGAAKVFTLAKILTVDEVLRDTGGPPRYESASLQFVVTDPTYTAF